MPPFDLFGSDATLGPPLLRSRRGHARFEWIAWAVPAGGGRARPGTFGLARRMLLSESGKADDDPKWRRKRLKSLETDSEMAIRWRAYRLPLRGGSDAKLRRPLAVRRTSAPPTLAL
jgi:hypothetical protein